MRRGLVRTRAGRASRAGLWLAERRCAVGRADASRAEGAIGRADVSRAGPVLGGQYGVLLWTALPSAGAHWWGRVLVDGQEPDRRRRHDSLVEKPWVVCQIFAASVCLSVVNWSTVAVFLRSLLGSYLWSCPRMVVS